MYVAVDRGEGGRALCDEIRLVPELLTPRQPKHVGHRSAPIGEAAPVRNHRVVR